MRILVHNISLALKTKKLGMPKTVGPQKCYAPKITSTNSKKLTENVFEFVIFTDCLKLEIEEKKSMS